MESPKSESPATKDYEVGDLAPVRSMDFTDTSENQQEVPNGNERCSGASADGEDSMDSSDDLPKDPFAPECKIPLPVTFAPFDYGWIEPSFIRKRNERERQRVRNVNDGFERLRTHLPLLQKGKDRRLSKVETLRYAISYIRHLQGMLKE